MSERKRGSPASTRVEWTPWFQIQHRNDGSGLIKISDENKSEESAVVASKIGWIMSEHEDMIGRRLLLVRDFNHSSHESASYREARESKNNALLNEAKNAAVENAVSTQSTSSKTLSEETTAAVAKQRVISLIPRKL